MKNDNDKNKKQKVEEKNIAQDNIEGEKNEETELLKQRLEEAEGNYKRALADYQNLQKRVAEQRSELILSANKDLLLRILTVLDTLVLASKHEQSETLKVCINQFEDILRSEGVKRIETTDAEFDPHLMEAIAIASNATDAGKEGKVLEEIKAGYTLNDKVLRPAQVKVGKE